MAAAIGVFGRVCVFLVGIALVHVEFSDTFQCISFADIC